MENLKLSKLSQNYPASGIRKMFDIAAKYDDVIKLTVGEPNFDTPEFIKDAAKNALDEGFVHYAPNAGIDELREALANKYHKYCRDYTKDNVIISCGALEGMTLTFLALLDPGDEILVPDPCFPNYYGQAMIVGAKAVPVPTYEKNGFRLQAEDVEKAITPKTKAIVLNSPCNPTGAVMTEEDVRAVAKLAAERDLWLFSDEPYDALVYDGVRPFSVGQIDEVRDRTVIFNSFSKTYAMTGWRLGFAILPDGYAPRFAQLQEGVLSCVSTFSQVAAVNALRSEECVGEMLKDYTRRRDILVDGINAIPGFRCDKPKGSFYAFPNIEAFGMTSQELAEDLVEKARVVVVPGSAFGECGEGHLRLVFANSDENLKEAVRRIADYVSKYHPDLK
ncbi:MAG: pyridoxal phosphate-dependent aminotransferase [Anaerovoracaceae bacterium]|nr:pyridoxal phosphate-dependent aminotransferase [Anaerovoracaceae bacterium]